MFLALDVSLAGFYKRFRTCGDRFVGQRPSAQAGHPLFNIVGPRSLSSPGSDGHPTHERRCLRTCLHVEHAEGHGTHPPALVLAPGGEQHLRPIVAYITGQKRPTRSRRRQVWPRCRPSATRAAGTDLGGDRQLALGDRQHDPVTYAAAVTLHHDPTTPSSRARPPSGPSPR